MLTYFDQRGSAAAVAARGGHRCTLAYSPARAAAPVLHLQDPSLIAIFDALEINAAVAWPESQ